VSPKLHGVPSRPIVSRHSRYSRRVLSAWDVMFWLISTPQSTSIYSDVTPARWVLTINLYHLFIYILDVTCLATAQTTRFIVTQDFIPLFPNIRFRFSPTVFSNVAHHLIILLHNDVGICCPMFGPVIVQQWASRISTNTELHTTVNFKIILDKQMLKGCPKSRHRCS
jgi:hypothetical protein